MKWLEELELDGLFSVLVTVGVISFAASVILLPRIVARWPAEHFMPASNREPVSGPLALALRIARNVLGSLLILAGILMLVLPGQGILTILVGVALCDFPGKRRIELWLLRLPGVTRALNWLRFRAGKAPLILPNR